MCPVDRSMPPDSSARAWPLAPLVVAALGLAVGIALDNAVGGGGAAALGVAFGAMLLLLVPRARRRAGLALVLVASAGAGMVRHHQAMRVCPSDHIVHFTRTKPVLARLRGTVVRRPTFTTTGFAPFEPWLYQQVRTSFVLTADEVETSAGWTAARGTVRVSVKAPALVVREGMRVEAFGWLYRPPGPANPGEVDWALFNRRNGLHAGLTCPSAPCVRALDGAAHGWRGRLRQAVRRMLLDVRLETGDEHASLLDAMILGRRSGMDRTIEQAFVDTGCAHYLAVSGVHVGMLALAIGWPARMLGAGRRRTAVVVTAAVAAYALLADPRPPILRAALMTAALCAAWCVRRRAVAAGGLSLAAAVILLVNPTALFDVGFQLSFVTVAGVLALHPVITQVLADGWGIAAARLRRGKPTTAEILRVAALHAPARPWRRWLGRHLLGLVSVSLAAWASSLPIVAANFGRVAPWGWLNSLIAFPFVFVVMVLGFIKMAVAALLPPADPAVGAALAAAADALLAVLRELVRLPVQRVFPAPAGWVMVAYYVGLAAVVVRMRAGGGRWLGAAAAGALLLAAVGWVWREPPSDLRITQFAVGRGTSTLIETPDGQVWLYDAGASGSYDPGEGVILPCLRQRGIQRIDGVIVSHANLDHFGGLPSVLAAARCGPVYLPPAFAGESEARTPGDALLKVLAARSHPVVYVAAGDELTLGAGVTAKVVWPPRDAPLDGDLNDSSLVLRLSYAGRHVLFTGDVGEVPQGALMADEAARARIRADVLTLPHHGSVVSNTDAFIAAVGAPHLVRSTFERAENSTALAALSAGRALYSTADVGAVEVLIGAGGVQVRGFRPPPDAGSPVQGGVGTIN